MRDRTTKALLLAIALGLWANVVSDWLRPVTVHANADQAEQLLRNIEADVAGIAGGLCLNSKIC